MIDDISISLFVRLEIIVSGCHVIMLPGRKVEELLCFLLLNREQPICRANLAEMLWPDAPPDHGRTYLRKALWKLQRALIDEAGTVEEQSPNWLDVEPEWIMVRQIDSFHLDVAMFEQAFKAAHNVAGRDLPPDLAITLHNAVRLYQGDLLENWYAEWLLIERERLQLAYFIMLEKLMNYCETHGELEDSLDYGMQLLGLDPTHERAHRMLMRYFMQSGRPAAALRQFEQCAANLEKELGLPPSERTLELYQQIHRGLARRRPQLEQSVADSIPPEISARLDALQKTISRAETELRALRSLLL